MDSSHELEDEDEDAAMAAFMGFSSFGSKGPAKKRKFNPTVDAFVEGQELEKLDRGGKKGTGSGGNTIPLGKKRVIGQGPKEKANNDEIDLDDEDEVQDDEPQYVDTSLPPPQEAQTVDDSEEAGPQYIDTSLPPPLAARQEGADGSENVDSHGQSTAEPAEIQARIDALLESIGSAPPGADSAQTHSAASPFDQVPRGLAQRPAVSGSSYSDASLTQGGSRGPAFSDAASMTSSRGGRGGHGGQRRGERNERWYEGYYDPSFNENPWAVLEKARGLQPVGTWVERTRPK